MATRITIMYSKVLSGSLALANEMATAAKGVKGVELTVTEFNAGSLTSGTLTTPLHLDEQKAALKALGIHTKVARGNGPTAVSSLANFSHPDLLEQDDILSGAGFPDAAQTLKSVRSQLNNEYAKTLKVAFAESAKAGNPSLSVAVKSTKKAAPGDSGVQLAKVAADLVVENEGRPGYDASVNVQPSGQIVNQLVMFPEKVGVVVAPPSDYGRTLGEITSGVAGGKKVVSIEFVGDQGSYMTARPGADKNALLRGLADLAEADKGAEIRKLINM